jgi:hypothetical protein
MALVSQARQGNSEDELDEMQREVDEIVRETLNYYEEGDLSAFSLALEPQTSDIRSRQKRLRCKSGVQTRLR